MSEYKGSIELLSGLKPANGQDFPLLQAKDVLMPDGVRLSDITYYGHRYSDAYKVIDISNERDKSINMYLFENGDGFDAVVKGSGHMLAGICPEDEVYMCLEDGVCTGFGPEFEVMFKPVPDLHEIYNRAIRYYPVDGATQGEYYINPDDINDIYKCISEVPATEVGQDQASYIQITDPEHFTRQEVFNFVPGQMCYSGNLYRYSNLGWSREKIYRLRIEDDVQDIGDYFMFKAHNLRNLSFADSSKIRYLGWCAFAYTGIRGTYSFPNLYQQHIHQIFRQCPYLEGVSFNNDIETIEEYSFEKCLSLRFVNDVISHGYLHIGDYAFKTCPNLKAVDIDTQVTTLGIGVFVNCDNKINSSHTDPITGDFSCDSMPLNGWQPGQSESNYHNWREEFGIPPYNFIWNTWLDKGLIDPDTGKVMLPEGNFTKVLRIPNTDYQYNPEYYQWSGEYILNTAPDAWNNKLIGRTSSCLSDQFYALFHVYNILHPNSQYDTYREFVEDKVLNSKLTVDSRLMAVLSGEVYARPDDVSEASDHHYYLASEDLIDTLKYSNMKFGEAVKYDIGEELTPANLPLSLNNIELDSGSNYAVSRGEGTSWWATCHALGLYYQQCNLADVQDRALIPMIDPTSGQEVIINRPAVAKEMLLNSIKRGVPGIVVRDICDMESELLQDQTYVVIGYDNDTDKFLVLESAWAYPSDIKPLTYWIKFEDLMLPTRWSAVITFIRKEELDMSNEDILVLRTLLNQVNGNVLAGNEMSRIREEDIQEKVNNIQNLMADGTSLQDGKVVKTGTISYYENYVQYDEERFLGSDDFLKSVVFPSEYDDEDIVNALPRHVMVSIHLPSKPKLVRVTGSTRYWDYHGDYNSVAEAVDNFSQSASMVSADGTRQLTPSFMYNADVYSTKLEDGTYGKFSAYVPNPEYDYSYDYSGDMQSTMIDKKDNPVETIRWTPKSSGAGGTFSFLVPAVLAAPYYYTAIL